MSSLIHIFDSVWQNKMQTIVGKLGFFQIHMASAKLNHIQCSNTKHKFKGDVIDGCDVTKLKMTSAHVARGWP